MFVSPSKCEDIHIWSISVAPGLRTSSKTNLAGTAWKGRAAPRARWKLCLCLLVGSDTYWEPRTSLALKQEVKICGMESVFQNSRSSLTWRGKEQINLSVQLSSPEAPATLTPLSCLNFRTPPPFLCLFVSLCLLRVSPSLSFLVVIFTKCLGKGSACPQVWIRFAQSLELCLALFALRPVKRVSASEGISYKTPWSCG